MFKRSLRSSWLPIVVAWSLSLTSCGPTAYMAIPTHEFPVAGPGQATFVLFQPRVRLIDVYIFDQNRRLLAQLSDRSQTSFVVPAGPVRLCVIWGPLTEAGDCIHGEVEAGRTYYATLGARGTGALFLVLSPRTKDNRWDNLDVYRQLPMVTLDPAHFDELQDRLLKLKRDPVKDAGAYEARGRPEHKAERTIHPEDGILTTSED